MLDLTAIKARRKSNYSPLPFTMALTDIDALLLEVERLQAENARLEAYYQQYTALIESRD